MSLTINGETGPYALSQPGGYGRNASYNLRKKYTESDEKQIQELTDNSVFKYSSTSLQENVFQNAMSYGLDTIKNFSSNKSDEVIFEDFSQATKKILSKALEFKKTFSVENFNKTAKNIFDSLDLNQDGKLDVPEWTANTLLEDKNMDGEITPEERKIFMDTQSKTPEVARTEALRILEKFDLKNHYEQFKKAEAEYEAAQKEGA